MAKRIKFQAPTGMRDILPKDQIYFQKIYNTAKDVADFYGFQKIDTPILEQAEIFERGTGEFTDIVEKEMYTLRTKGGDFLALRPEGTPGIVRAYLQNGLFTLPSPIKLWYSGPFFRRERPQAGRFREFHHIGLEVFKEQSPVIDAQIIQIFYTILKELGFKNLVIELNSIGDKQCRPYYKKLLVRYLKSRESLFCPNCKKRIRKNPLRVLDCKQEKCQQVISRAPQMIDHLCEECHAHFREVLEFLDDLGLPYTLNPYLVRGLDYYTKTVFEIISKDSSDINQAFSRNNSAKELAVSGKRGRPPKNFVKDIADNLIQDNLKTKPLTLVGGGRYDSLVKILGGKDTPACGAALGVERVVNIMKKDIDTKDIKPDPPKIFLAQLGKPAKRQCLKIFEDFRKAKISTAELFSRDSLTAQMKAADRMGVDYTLILGQKEILDKVIIARTMKTGEQKIIKIEKIVEEMKKRLKKA